jgi:hypothetical protein
VARGTGLKPSWLRRVLTTLGGADSQILARAQADTAEMTGRGIAALIPAAFGGLAALISRITSPLSIALGLRQERKTRGGRGQHPAGEA